ncbi:uncharacterized protein C4orf36 homolog [Erinaceus europaeus]|uniref:Uncharacterized protein C4orf36 homolog n=1 Tax=Erinaceus europaeus TaxID=9365 RepID=A0A1S3A9I2_ERIEU|nr:uncharacterized protein C4orf36 homolog [Erinaceus europaeus]
MAYGLPRRKTVKSLLWGSCYNVQEPWDLALLTKTWYENLAKMKLPFLEEISFGNLVRLKNCKAVAESLFPSAECIKVERDYEIIRLNNLKRQEKAAEKIQCSLREKPVGLRRPLPPKCEFPN